MKRYTPALFVLLPLLANAAQPEWLGATRQTEQEILHFLEDGRREVDNAIVSLGRDSVAPARTQQDESLPPLRNGCAVAVADGGLLFDTANSRVTYLDNVRVNEARANMRCRHRLYIRLPQSRVVQSGEKALNQTASAPPLQAAAPGATPRELPAPAQPPLQVWAYDAMVDGVENHILLRSNGKEGIPRLRRGEDELLLSPGAQGTRILADAHGNIHVCSGGISLSWTDAEGRRGSLVAEDGYMVFHRGNHTLYIPGVSHFTAPDGTTLDCEDSLCVTLMPVECTASPENGGFLSQFTSLRYSGVEKAVVAGKVHVRRPATGTTPASAVQGEICTYDGRTGACAIEGANCRLTYGAQRLETRGGSGSIVLSPRGDIRMRGEHGLCGAYELPARGETPARRGTFETPGDADFDAASATVRFAKGIRAQDPLNRFCCTGPLSVVLKRGTQAAPDRQKTAMVNLAIAACNDISTAHATGDVEMHYFDPQKNIPMDVRGDETTIDLDKGTAQVRAAAGKNCMLGYGAYKLDASGTAGASHAAVDEHGDIDVQADTIHAVLPNPDRTAELHTNGMLHLTRATRELMLGPGSRLHATEGILTANDKLCITLAPAEGTVHDKPATPRYPHLNYTFGGVESARTDHGGTLQTAKASMQCSGPIRAAFATGRSATSNLHATVEGDVAILGKDSANRLIRATGDRLCIDGDNKVLTGSRVTLADEKNTHIATGKGACVSVDADNNARLTGEKHVTHATGLREQTGKNNFKKEKKD